MRATIVGLAAGYGDLVPVTTNERIFSIVFMLFGVAGFGYAGALRQPLVD